LERRKFSALDLSIIDFDEFETFYSLSVARLHLKKISHSKNMTIDSLSKKPLKTKRHQSEKWLMLVFVAIFSFASIGSINLSRAQGATDGATATSTPEVSLSSDSPTANASSTLPTAPVTPDSNASSTPEVPGASDLTNASSTLSAAVCGNGIVEEGEQCDDNNLIAGDGCNSACKTEIVVPDVATGLDLNLGGNQRPVVQAVWQMNQATSTDSQAQDDSLIDGVQFMPSGQYQVDKNIDVCAVASDPDGLADLTSVSYQIYYPQDIYLGPNRALAQPGCGQAKDNSWLLMTALDSNQGLDLFCQQLRNKNANLASFKTGNDFATLCGSTGDLAKGTAKVFCGHNSLAYNDPAGKYRVKTVALDKKNEAGVMENNFKYLELVAFEIDFDNIDYGSMRLNSPKVLAGNDVFSANDGRPTIRNIGNTRLDISIKQNDMGLGQSETGWNLTYQTRIGQDASFINYWPETWTNLLNSMNLGQTSALDLAIEVLKFPEAVVDAHYAGKLSLNATAALPLLCTE